MNYIKQLQEENKSLRDQLYNMQEKTIHARGHLLHSKFHIDSTIQVNDVDNILCNILSIA